MYTLKMICAEHTPLPSNQLRNFGTILIMFSYVLRLQSLFYKFLKTIQSTAKFRRDRYQIVARPTHYEVLKLFTSLTERKRV